MVPLDALGISISPHIAWSTDTQMRKLMTCKPKAQMSSGYDSQPCGEMAAGEPERETWKRSYEGTRGLDLAITSLTDHNRRSVSESSALPKEIVVAISIYTAVKSDALKLRAI